MNIFFIDRNPKQAAEWMVDKHVVKMILETSQLLCTAHRFIDGVEYEGKTQTGRKAKRWKLDDGRDTLLYTATHINHPSAVWCRSSVENYNWTVDHLFALISEYKFRYNKDHKVIVVGLAYALQSPPNKLKNWDWTEPPCAMAEEYVISDDPVLNYRNYYKNGKSHLHSWKNRNPPNWI